ncbi:MAG TPA: peptidoglycan DD-metalloendopeptidase family protein [Paludibacter sp.]
MRFQPNFRILVIIFSMMTSIFTLQAQTVKELENQRKQTLQRLETTSKMLNETKKSQRSSLTKLTIISKNINERKVLIKNISTEIGQLNTEMQRLDQEKRTLENKLTSLKSDYVKLVQEAHIKRSMYAKIMFVLSSKTFDQSYRRLRYLQEYTDYRKEQVLEIEKVKVQIAQKNDSLNKNKSTKVDVVKQKVTEAKKLTKDEQQEKVLLTDLQKKEKKLHDDLKVQQKKANDLNRKIEAIIAAEIRKAEAKRAAAERKRLADESRSKGSTTKYETKTRTSNKPSSSSSLSVSALTKEETLLSGDFQRNIGRLPWPTTNGFIRGHYGIQPHPVLKYVTTNNKGIYIQTPAGSTARAVFEGIVTQSFDIQGSHGVIIQHGNYRTVYANLTQIFVHEGERVTAKQTLGRIYTDSENDNKTELYFQVYKDRNTQNPESWLTR